MRIAAARTDGEETLNAGLPRMVEHERVHQEIRRAIFHGFGFERKNASDQSGEMHDHIRGMLVEEAGDVVLAGQVIFLVARDEN